MEKKKIVEVKNETAERTVTFLIGNNAASFTDFISFRRVTFDDGTSVKRSLKADPFFKGDVVFVEKGVVGHSPQEVLRELALIKQDEKNAFRFLVKMYVIVTLAVLLLVWAVCH